MNIAELQKKLIAAARQGVPEDHVPYAFEKRIMARLRRTPVLDEWTQWVRALWLGAGVCTAVALLTSVWSLTIPADPDFGPVASTDLERTILSSGGDRDSAW